jgi:hypothetical protein
LKVSGVLAAIRMIWLLHRLGRYFDVLDVEELSAKRHLLWVHAALRNSSTSAKTRAPATRVAFVSGKLGPSRRVL